MRYAGYSKCVCRDCQGDSIWNEAEGRCVDPIIGGGPRPHVDMPDDVKMAYEEARRIVGMSPRGACALLRLAVQKLCVDLGEKGEKINDDIASLVEKGLPVEVQQALDSLRVIGNEAVHQASWIFRTTWRPREAFRPPELRRQGPHRRAEGAPANFRSPPRGKARRHRRARRRGG